MNEFVSLILQFCIDRKGNDWGRGS